MSQKFNLAIVNYLNAKPFLFGLAENKTLQQKFNIQLLNPAECARSFKEQQSDIALVPVGALPSIGPYDIITDFGIACKDKVATVCVFSNQPLQLCSKIFLDNHSRTSVLLAQIIVKEFLKYDMIFEYVDVQNLQLMESEAVLLIGDKVFEREKLFRYKYDLGELWNKFTELPFVFAVWIARPGLLSQIDINELNICFQYGISNIDQVIDLEDKPHIPLYDYFTRNIQYQIQSPEYQSAITLFLSKIKTFGH